MTSPRVLVSRPLLVIYGRCGSIIDDDVLAGSKRE